MREEEGVTRNDERIWGARKGPQILSRFSLLPLVRSVSVLPISYIRTTFPHSDYTFTLKMEAADSTKATTRHIPEDTMFSLFCCFVPCPCGHRLTP
jgi:hypothetical protein